MKKSQVLAALALAFALGVVAPVASVINATDTYAVEYDPTRAASYCDVMNAVAAVRGYGYYPRYEAIYNLVVKWLDTDNKVYYGTLDSSVDYKLEFTYTSTLADGSGFGVSRIGQSLAGYINAIRGSHGNTQPAVSTTVTDLTDLKLLVKAAEATHYSNVDHGDFASFKTLFLQMVKSNRDINVTEFRNAVEGVAGSNDASIGSDWEASDIRAYVLGTKQGVDGAYWKHVDEYEAFARLMAWYFNANTYIAFTDGLNDALNNAPELSTVTKNAIKDAYEGKAAGQPDPARALYDIAHNNYNSTTGLGIKGFNVNNYPTTYGYAQLIANVNAAEEDADKRDGGESWENRKLIDAIGYSFDKAVAIVPGTTRTTFKTLMSAYNGTCGKTNNDGTGDGTNKPEDDKKPTTDPNAPDTGILADGEANASTTVAMVAGIATALTAAGAGVVAYRNARRSTRK